MELRRLTAGDGPRLRELRLHALRDAPFAFSSTFRRESELPGEHWEQLARQSGAGEAGAVFVAVDGGEWVGMAGGYLPEHKPGTAIVWGMWVAPAARRRGLGRRLLEAVAAWARERGLAQLELSVSDRDGSQAAAALYRELGFAPTGEREPLESDPSLTAPVLARAL